MTFTSIVPYCCVYMYILSSCVIYNTLNTLDNTGITMCVCIYKLHVGLLFQ